MQIKIRLGKVLTLCYGRDEKYHSVLKLVEPKQLKQVWILVKKNNEKMARKATDFKPKICFSFSGCAPISRITISPCTGM